MRTYIGQPDVYLEDDGTCTFDLDSISREVTLQGSFSGAEEWDEFGDEDFGDEDFGEEDSSDDDDFTDDDDSSDDDDDDEEFGATRGRRRRQARRGRRRSKRKSRRGRRRGSSSRSKKKVTWQKTVVVGAKTEEAAGAVNATKQLQHNLIAEDIVFNGSSEGAAVNTIIFGDDLVWHNDEGVDISTFSSTSFIRGLVKGAKLRTGGIISVTGTLPDGGGTLKFTIVGKKPKRADC